MPTKTSPAEQLKQIAELISAQEAALVLPRRTLQRRLDQLIETGVIRPAAVALLAPSMPGCNLALGQ